MTTTPPKTMNDIPFIPLTPESIDERERGRSSSPSPSPDQSRRRSRSRLTSLSLRRRPTSTVQVSSEPIVLTADALLAVETSADKLLTQSLSALPARAKSPERERESEAEKDLKTPVAPNPHGIRNRVLSLSRRGRPGVAHMASEPNLGAQAQAHTVAASLRAESVDGTKLGDAKESEGENENGEKPASTARRRARVLSLSLRRRPVSVASNASVPTARALAESLAAGAPPSQAAQPVLPMTPPPSEPRTSAEHEVEVKSVTSIESVPTPERKRTRVLSLSMRRPTSILRRQGSSASLSSGHKSHTEEPATMNPSYVQSQLDEARASLRSKEGEVTDLAHERDALRHELEEAREEMKSLQEAIEEKREELGSLEEVRTALVLREELKQAKEEANVQDELVGFLQGRLAEVELTAEAERRAKQTADERTAACEVERDALKAEKARLETEASKRDKQLSDLQSRNTQMLGKVAELDARLRERAAKVGELEAALRQAREQSTSAESRWREALERIAALELECARATSQEEALRMALEERRALEETTQAQAAFPSAPKPKPRHRRPSIWGNPYVEILGVVAAVMGTRALLWWLGHIDVRELLRVSSCDAGAFAHGCLRAISS